MSAASNAKRRASNAIPMGAPGSTAKSWCCSCGHRNRALGTCKGCKFRSRTVSPEGRPQTVYGGTLAGQGRQLNRAMEALLMIGHRVDIMDGIPRDGERYRVAYEVSAFHDEIVVHSRKVRKLSP